MSRPTLTAVLSEPGGWTLAIAHDDPQVPPPRGAALGELVAAAAARGVATRGPVCLGLPADRVYAACLPVPAQGPRRERETALAFALEEKLPVDLEDVVTAFGPAVRPAAGPAVRLGLAAERAGLSERLAAARAAGLQVNAAVPTALLVAAGDTSPGDAAVWVADTSADAAACCSVVERLGGTPHTWRLHPGPSAAAPAPSDPSAPAPLTPAAALAAAARAAPSRVAGFNLARGPLRPAGAAAAQARPWAAFAAALGLLLGSAGVCGLLAAGAHRAAAAAERAATVSAYRAAFPGTEVPVDLLGRLRSAARAQALGPVPAAAPSRADTLAALTALAARWPDAAAATAGLHIDALTLGPQTLSLSGEADAAAAIDALTDALAAAGQPTAVPPVTQLMPRGQTRFELRLADRAAANQAAAAQGGTP